MLAETVEARKEAGSPFSRRDFRRNQPSNSSFPFFFFLSWGIVALPYCVGFCCTRKGISYIYTHPSLLQTSSLHKQVRINSCCFKPPSLWYVITAALGNQGFPRAALVRSNCVQVIKVSLKRMGVQQDRDTAEALQGCTLRPKSSRGKLQPAPLGNSGVLWSVSYTSELSQTEAKGMGLPTSPTVYPWSGYKLPVTSCSLYHQAKWPGSPRASSMEEQ